MVIARRIWWDDWVVIVAAVNDHANWFRTGSVKIIIDIWQIFMVPNTAIPIYRTFSIGTPDSAVVLSRC
jgi:hypothetical protein